MESIEIFLFIFSALSVIGIFVVFLEVQSVKQELESLNWKYAFGYTPKTPDVPVQDAPETPEEPADLSDTAEVLTASEIARMEREKEFDQRIAQIKEELALRNDPVTRRGTEAVVLHPHVHNLPHTAIPEFSDELPDVEITY